MSSEHASLRYEAAQDTAIRVTAVSKCFHIYERPQDRLKQSIMPRLQRLVGRPPKQYHREFWALNDVSLEIKKGDTIGIVGRNGSGKSTLLQLICGTLAPTSGSIETYGRIAAMLELGAGFNPEFTGRENVYLNAAVLGLSHQQIDTRFDAIASFADIGQFIEQPVKTYSSGMLMRLAFATMAHVDADILVIDEALAVGDAFFVQKCMRFLRDFQRQGTTLFVSHDTAAMINLCTGASWLDQGRIRMRGKPKDVCETYLQALHEHHAGHRMARRGSIRVADSHDAQRFFFNRNAAGFGAGGATVIDVRLVDEDHQPLSSVAGGESVTLAVTCLAHMELLAPIVGFFVKDRLGQTLFGDNTYLSYAHEPPTVPAASALEARFRFDMPRLPPGDYSVSVAVAEGTQESHVQHHWVHDALVFKSHASAAPCGLVGIPVYGIELRTASAQETAWPTRR